MSNQSYKIDINNFSAFLNILIRSGKFNITNIANNLNCTEAEILELLFKKSLPAQQIIKNLETIFIRNPELILETDFHIKEHQVRYRDTKDHITRLREDKSWIEKEKSIAALTIDRNLMWINIGAITISMANIFSSEYFKYIQNFKIMMLAFSFLLISFFTVIFSYKTYQETLENERVFLIKEITHFFKIKSSLSILMNDPHNIKQINKYQSTVNDAEFDIDYYPLEELQEGYKTINFQNIFAMVMTMLGIITLAYFYLMSFKEIQMSI